MGEYVYRRSSRWSRVTLEDGTVVPAVHLVYAYKPYIMGWDSDKANSRMRRTALMHVGTADRILAMHGQHPDGFKYAVVVSDDHRTEGAEILRFNNHVPKLVSDYTFDAKHVTYVPYPCQECGGTIRRTKDHPVCQEVSEVRLQQRMALEEAERQAQVQARAKAREEQLKSEEVAKARAAVAELRAQLAAAEQRLGDLS
jgi:hypothetical protein